MVEAGQYSSKAGAFGFWTINNYISTLYLGNYGFFNKKYNYAL